MLSRLGFLFGLIFGSSALSWAHDSKNTENPKIVGGVETGIIEAPFICQLFHEGKHLCGSSIISHNFLLTAAHCTEGIPANELKIRCGSNKRGDGDLLYVSNIFFHPMYNSDNMDNDFCLLKIFGKIFYDDTKRAIKLPEEYEEPNVNDYVRALGWGRTMNNGESMDYLRSVVLIVISSDDCERAYEGYNVLIHPNKMCTLHPERLDGKDACSGDSGGPLQGLADGKLLGVVSFGVGCAKKEFPGVYAMVSSARRWIKETSNV